MQEGVYFILFSYAIFLNKNHSLESANLISVTRSQGSHRWTQPLGQGRLQAQA